MNEISMIGLDIAKNVFQVHGVDASGKMVLRRQLAAQRGGEVLCEAAAVHGGDGGVWERALLGSGDQPLWA